MLMTSDIGVMGDLELDRVTREEFGEEEEAMDKALGEMEEWIDSQPQFVNTKRDRDWLRSTEQEDREACYNDSLQGVLQRL